MSATQYSYSNNGLFPIRYIARKGFKPTYAHDAKPRNEKSLKNLVRGFQTRGVSEATQRKILKHSRVLGLSAEKRTVRNSKGHYVQHLISFITLTLPSQQQHDDQFLTKNVLGVFLDKCRKFGILQNYVWRAEKQKNGNIHYHLITDSYAPFSVFRRFWYLALRPYGYIQAYKERFYKMTFQDYCKVKGNEKRTMAQLTSAFAYGKRTNWEEPPACQADYLQSEKEVAAYISKYISKDEAEGGNFVKGRTWGVSQSVAAATKAFTKDRELSEYWYNAGAQILKRREYVADFFSVVKCRVNSLFAWFPETRAYARALLRKYFSPCEFWRNSVGLGL